MSRPPGPSALQALPLALQVLRDPRVVVTGYTRKYGPVWQTLILDQDGFHPLVWLMGPQGNERVLAQQHREDFSWYEGYRFTMEPLFGRDILLLLDDTEGAPAHRLRHRLLLPAFHPRMDGDYIGLMEQIILHHLSRIRSQVDDGAEVDLAAELKRITFHIVVRLLLGASEEDLLSLGHLFEELGLGLFSTLRVALPGFRYYRGIKARQALAARLRERVTSCQKSGDVPSPMLGALLHQGPEGPAGGEALSDETLVGEMIAFVFAGYDTTSSMLTSFFACLGGRPDLYAGIRDEALSLGSLTHAALQEQAHLGAALLETERLHPPLVFAMRGALRDFRFGGHDIRAGSKVAYSTYYTARMPELFPRPEEFLPERFLPGERRPPPYAIVGFGGGHRSCIGKRFAQLEMRVLINLLLRHFDIEFIPGQSDEVFFNPAMQRRHGLRVRLRRASGASVLPRAL